MTGEVELVRLPVLQANIFYCYSSGGAEKPGECEELAMLYESVFRWFTTFHQNTWPLNFLKFVQDFMEHPVHRYAAQV